MRLARAKVQSYRSVKDSGWFEVESGKTILVGPNEAGKTAILRALEHISPPPVVKPFEPLRDYPRSEYYRIQSGSVHPKDVVVAEAEFALEDGDRAALRVIAPGYEGCRYRRAVYLDNHNIHNLVGGPELPKFSEHKDSLKRLAAHADGRVPAPSADAPAASTLTTQLELIVSEWSETRAIGVQEGKQLQEWLETTAPHVDEANEPEKARLTSLRDMAGCAASREAVLKELHKRLPPFVYFSTYTRVTPLLHLGHLADAIEAGAIDEKDTYNFGNFCLLKLLNSSARQLSDLGKAPEPAANDSAAFEAYRARLDERDAMLNAASLRLTQQIHEVWYPASGGPSDAGETGDYKVRIKVDQQYLKVVVEDSLGVEVEIDQRSEGFQWLVSFFIVFFAQASDRLLNAVLLLDEPGA